MTHVVPAPRLNVAWLKVHTPSRPLAPFPDAPGGLVHRAISPLSPPPHKTCAVALAPRFSACLGI
eukprot:7797909-Alexandrium_andersonii.AAC.1